MPCRCWPRCCNARRSEPPGRRFGAARAARRKSCAAARCRELLVEVDPHARILAAVVAAVGGGRWSCAAAPRRGQLWIEVSRPCTSRRGRRRAGRFPLAAWPHPGGGNDAAGEARSPFLEAAIDSLSSSPGKERHYQFLAAINSYSGCPQFAAARRVIVEGRTGAQGGAGPRSRCAPLCSARASPPWRARAVHALARGERESTCMSHSSYDERPEQVG
jgi:hypothetical protein